MEYHNCRVCNDVYETHTEKDSVSRDETGYGRYLGFCHAGCYNKMSEREKSREHFFAYVYGDTRKRNKLKFKKKV
jgi:hypothetical protein